MADLIRAWSVPSKKHSSSDLTMLAAVVELVKSFLKRDAEDFVRRLDGKALLVQYSGDGTPVASRCSVAARSGDNTVKRSGRGTQEYYVQNCFLVALDAMGHR